MLYKVKDTDVEINIGEVFSGTETYTFGPERWRHQYTVLEAEQKERFGHPDVLLTVKKEAVYLNKEKVSLIEPRTRVWLTQCF